ncbi:Bifunctional hemolysin/adenylate cyclase precursor [Planctomycetes bacterium CA13]|uniref:Bifunctional hemolysin/adenylate cyclase n=1 Tax=Novipirellula herctigrandis TaxID=2527986 RepID=A0A5C5ZBR2_9BACT|nr:Bifunctional hemolysin/adenylate cyclase precursor [Planctomycetes bacterium CA13]
MFFRRKSKPRLNRTNRRRLFAERLEDRRLLTTIYGVDAGDQSGFSVSNAGDVNGDGFDDLIIGAEFAAASENAKSRAGESYVVFGTSTPAATIDLGNLGAGGLTIFGADANDWSGRAVSGAGDVNGDGLDDLLVGAPGADKATGETGEGESFLIFGSTSLPGTIDLANLGSAGVVIRGGSVGDVSGYAVSSAGDFNGDGYADLLIGAPLADGTVTTSDSGKAYLVYGEPLLPGTIDLDSLGAAGLLIDLADTSDNSGQSISNAGDVNGDGRDDIIVGAPRSNGAADARNLSGESYLIFGFDQRRTTAITQSNLSFHGLTIFGTDADDRSGSAVSGAGDVNGDGFDDLLIGAPFAGSLSNTRLQAGESYLIFGGESLPASIDLQTPGAADVILYGDTQDNHGIAVSRAGDLNGDGFDDLVVGADGADGESDNQPSAGDVYVMFGSNSLPATIDFSLPGAAGLSTYGAVSGDRIGSTLSTAEDFNGDGFDDLVIGAPLISPAGESYLIFGGDLTGTVTHAGTAAAETLTGDIAANVMIGGSGDDLLLGRGGGDVLRGGEGDDRLSIGDMGFTRIVGGNGFDTLLFETSGHSLDLTDRSDNRILGIEQIDIRGTGPNTLSLGLQDVLNISDESNTLVIRRDEDDAVSIGLGWIRGADETIYDATFRVFTLDAATIKVESDPMTINLASLPIGQGTTFFGISPFDIALHVGGAGDVNGDGLDDFLIGATGAGRSGQTYLVYGTDSPLAPMEVSSLGLSGVTINGIDTFDDSGSGVSLADINGDGFSDVLIGSPFADGENNAFSQKGESYVIFGGPALPSTIDLASLGTDGVTIFGAANDDRMGYAINNAGDVNGDGFDDMIVGSHTRGSAYLVFGGPNLPATIDLASLGSAGVTMPGARTVGQGGDFNGDGFDDVLVALTSVDFGRGATYVVYGAATMPETITMSFLGASGVTINGESSSDGSGTSISFAGDVNGDGFDDLITGSLRGRSHVVFGGSSLPSMINLLTLGTGGVEFFAVDSESLSVGGAGDVNGDGFDDLLVGSPSGDGIDQSKVGSGETYIIFGSTVLPPVINAAVSLAGITIYGVDSSDSSGVTVDIAGDVNGDGFDDILIGASSDGANNGTSGAGESHLVLGSDFLSTVTHKGGSQADSLTGDKETNVMIGGRGDDELVGAGGRDVLRGGEGDDILAVGDLTFARLVGGNGFDTLRLDTGGVTLDLTTLPDNRILGIEQIDIVGTGDNTLTLDLQEVLNISDESNTLVVRKDADDTVNVGAGWIQQPGEWIDGGTYHVFTQGAAILKIQTPPIGINLTVSLSEAAENEVSVVTVTATNDSNVTGNQTVDLVVTGIGISPGDFSLSASQIVILDGQSSGSVTFTVVDDEVVESLTETATLTISNPTSGLNVGIASQNVNITDNDFLTPVIDSGAASPSNLSPIPLTVDFGGSVTGFDLSDLSVLGATTSNLVDLTGGRFSFDLTPSADGAITVDIGAAAAKDVGGKDTLAASQFAIISDRTLPTPTITGPASPTSSDPFNVTIEFGESVSGFVIGDVTVGGGTASNLVDDGNGSFTATIDATADGLVTVDVAADVTVDGAGNPNIAATQFSIVVDTTLPTPMITGPGSPTSSDPFTVTIDFGESVSGFVIGDVTVGGGTASNLIDNGNGNFTATIDAATDGLVTVDVAADVAIDDASNSNDAATQFSVVVDTTDPAPTITGPASPTSSDPFTVTIDFGESVSGFVIGDVTVGGGTASKLADNGNGSFTATIDAIVDGLVTIDVAANVAVDDVGNPNIAASQFSIVVDSSVPAPTITGPTSPTSSDPFIVTIDFGETVTGFVIGDITVEGGTASNLVDNGNGSFTASINATADGAVTVNVASNVTVDDAGNSNNAATQFSIIVDTLAPVPIITGPAGPTNSDPFIVTIDFGETVTGFVIGDITVGGGTASNLVDSGNGSFTATIDAITDGVVTVDVGANVAVDDAGNSNDAASQFAIVVDTNVPKPTITGPASPTSSDPFNVTIDFGETVNSFEISDVTVRSGTATNLVDNGNGSFTATIDATTDGVVTVNVAANVAIDDAGNPNVAASRFSIVVDTTAPAPTITGPASPTSSDLFTVTIEFGESVTGFVIGDITVESGTASNLIDNGNGSFTATIDATADGNVSVGVAAGVTSDQAGNSNLAATPVVVVVDTTPPNPTAPTNRIVEGNAVGGTSDTDAAIQSFLVGASATDNIDASVTITHDAPAFFPVGDTLVTFTAVDDAGNSATATATVTVIDTTTPTITAPADITVEGDTTGGAAKANAAIAVFLAAATGSDIVDDSLTITDDAPAVLPVGDTLVTFTTVDDAGNSATATATVTVIDTTRPTITAPADITVEANVVGGAEATQAAVHAFLTSAVSTDNVDDAPVITHDGPAVFPPGETTVTFTATDDAGNITSDTATVTVTVSFDFGDAPTTYPVTRLQDGARHLAGSLFLGTVIDVDADGQPDAGAAGDDNAGDADEDGVVAAASLVVDASTTTTSSFRVTASEAGKLDTWIDFDGDGIWDVPGEQIFDSFDVVAGVNLISFTVPAGATAGDTAARFRLSRDGNLEPTGEAADGEVEDYIVSILDGNVAGGASAIIDLAGDSMMMVQMGDLVVRAGDTEIFRARTDNVGTLNLSGGASVESVTIDTSSGLAEAAHVTLDGGDGADSLVVIGDGGEIDLMGSTVRAVNFEMLDLSFADKNVVRLDAASVAALSPDARRIRIITSKGDKVDISDADDWRMSDPVRENGKFYLTAANVNGGGETIEVQHVHVWHNFLRPGDVNNDGNVTAIDALRVINELTQRDFSDGNTQKLSEAIEVNGWPNAYLDLNADGRATALDALLVINDLVLQKIAGESGEGEVAASLIKPVREHESHEREKQNEYTLFELETPVETPTGTVMVTDTLPVSQIVPLADVARETSKSTEAVDRLLSDDSFLDGLNM